MSRVSGGSVAAVDLGATSGRVMLGYVGHNELSLRPVARFPNGPVTAPDGLHWNITGLYRQVIGGLASALHSGDPAYEPLAEYFATHLAPTLERLLAAARASGEIVQEVDATEFLGAVANLCHGGEAEPGRTSPRAERMVGLLLAGLRAEPAREPTR